MSKSQSIGGDTRWGGNFRGDYRPQVKIGDKWSYGEWELQLGKDWNIDPATAKTTFVDIPAGDGSLDMSEALTGEPVYGRRNIKFDLVTGIPDDQWERIRMELDNYCNGQKMRLIFPHDPHRFFIGRFNVKSVKRDGPIMTISVEVNAEPWRYKISPTIHNATVPDSGTITLRLHNERRRTNPIVKTGDDDIVLKFRNLTAELRQNGEYRMSAFYLEPGVNEVVITGKPGAIASISYQEGSL
jgi:hypothetical protein